MELFNWLSPSFERSWHYVWNQGKKSQVINFQKTGITVETENWPIIAALMRITLITTVTRPMKKKFSQTIHVLDYLDTSYTVH